MTLTNLFLLVVWGATFLIVMIRLFQSIRIVPQRSVYILERLGKYNGTLHAGIHFLIPFLDKVVYQMSLKEEAIDVPPQECFTQDEVKVMVDGVLYISVVDPAKAAYGSTSYKFASTKLAQTTTRSVIGKLSLDRTFEEREMISAKVVQVLAETGVEWGIRVHRYEIKNIQPPTTVHESMEMQVTAERDRKAIVAKAEGEMQSKINRAEGARQEMINRSEGEKQKRINEAEGRASAIKALADASGESIEKIAAAIVQPGGMDAIRLQLTERYFGGLDHLGKNGSDILIAGNIIDIDDLLSKVGLGKDFEKENQLNL